jgi:sigma-B regulation protein RsbU (phosphoserine phosphatase)
VGFDPARVIVEHSPVILFRRKAGDDPVLVYVSDNIRRWGYEPEALLEGRITFRDICHPDDRDRVREEILHYREQDVEEYEQGYRVLTRDGEVRWIEDRTSVVRDEEGRKIYNQGILLDVTERKNAEDALRRSEETYRRIIETTGQGFIRMDGDLVIRDANDAYCRMLGYGREELVGRTPLSLASPASRRFLETHRDRLLSRDAREFEIELVAKNGRRVPVLVHGNTLRDDRGEAMGNIAFVTDLTEQKQSLLLAAEIQRQLMPRTSPPTEGLEIAGRSVPCDEIGGDYFDFIADGNPAIGPVCLVVGDITGHGVDAALFMTASRSFLRLRASQPGSARQIVSDMNRHLSRDTAQTGRFMTLLLMVVDPANGRLRWVRAGHDPALVYHPDDDRFETLMGPGIALGVDPDFSYQENDYRLLRPGQVILLATDGIREARSPAGEMFGADRLRRVVRDHWAEGAEPILHAVYDALERFMGGARPEDDMTLVVARVVDSRST